MICNKMIFCQSICIALVYVLSPMFSIQKLQINHTQTSVHSLVQIYHCNCWLVMLMSFLFFCCFFFHTDREDQSILCTWVSTACARCIIFLTFINTCLILFQIWFQLSLLSHLPVFVWRTLKIVWTCFTAEGHLFVLFVYMCVQRGIWCRKNRKHQKSDSVFGTCGIITQVWYSGATQRHCCTGEDGSFRSKTLGSKLLGAKKSNYFCFSKTSQHMFTYLLQ